MTHIKHLAVLLVAIVPVPSLPGRGGALHNQVSCESRNLRNVVAVTAPDFHFVSTVPQPNGDLEPLLQTTVTIPGTARTCLVAHFSAMAVPTDNYIVFQVRVDGVPMRGHLSSFGLVPVPVVITIEETDLNVARMVAYNFFALVEPGVHTVEVMVGAGSGISPLPNPQPHVGSPVLILYHR
jgi:hypothetical protein